MKKYILLSVTALCLAATSCSPFNVRTDYSQTANFNQYKTYKLRITDLKLNYLDQDRVLNEVSRQLQAKGFSVSENPDLIVNVKANHKKINDVQKHAPYGVYGWGGGFGWGFGMSRTFSSHYNEGSLLVDIIDAKTNRLVWQGIGEGIQVDRPEAKRKEIPMIVSEIMKNFPPNQIKR